MNEIPPDAPAGCWTALCSVKKHKTSKEQYPMLILEWRLTEAHTDGEAQENAVGGRVTDFLTFFPASHTGTRMSRMRLKEMCAALKIDPPAVTRIESWDDIAEFVSALEGLQATIYTAVTVRKDTGEQQTRVSYAPPRGYEGGGPTDKSAEKPTTAKKVTKKKTKTPKAA